MDSHLLEFWGNILIQAARSQQQLEELARWTRDSKNLFEEQKTFLKKMTNEEEDKGTDYVEKWKESAENFRSSFHEMMDLFGMVPKEDYKALQKRCEELERELTLKEDLIRKGELEEAGKFHSDVADGIQDLIRKQGEQYRELMHSMSVFYKKGHSPKGKSRK